MIYDYDVPVIKGTYIKTYLAKITGEDPLFRFNRRFMYRNVDYSPGFRCYSYDIGDYGVFEQSIKRYDFETDKLILCEREWFVNISEDLYEIDYQDVLFCVFNLKAQYSLLKLATIDTA